MRTFLMPLSALAVAAAMFAVSSAQPTGTILMPGNLQWTTNQMPKGAARATLAGNPNGTGWFVLRLKMHSGTTNQPHTHRTTEILSVMSGTLGVGFGTSVNKSTVRSIPAGGVVVIPPGVPHYTTALSDVVYDVSGMGPATNIPIKK